MQVLFSFLPIQNVLKKIFIFYIEIETKQLYLTLILHQSFTIYTIVI